MKPCTVNDNAQSDESPKQDSYARIDAKIVAAPGRRRAALGQTLEHRNTPPGALRDRCVTTASPTPPSMFSRCVCRPACRALAAPIWMTDRQAVELYRRRPGKARERLTCLRREQHHAQRDRHRHRRRSYARHPLPQGPQPARRARELLALHQHPCGQRPRRRGRRRPRL